MILEPNDYMPIQMRANELKIEGYLNEYMRLNSDKILYIEISTIVGPGLIGKVVELGIIEYCVNIYDKSRKIVNFFKLSSEIEKDIVEAILVNKYNFTTPEKVVLSECKPYFPEKSIKIDKEVIQLGDSCCYILIDCGGEKFKIELSEENRDFLNDNGLRIAEFDYLMTLAYKKLFNTKYDKLSDEYKLKIQLLE